MSPSSSSRMREEAVMVAAGLAISRVPFPDPSDIPPD